MGVGGAYKAEGVGEVEAERQEGSECTLKRRQPYSFFTQYIILIIISLPQISEGGEDEDEDEAKEVYFVPQDSESRKYCYLCMSYLVDI